MRKIKLLFIFTLFIPLGCNDFLTTELNGIYTNTTFYQTEEHAFFAINATYEVTAFKNINNNLWVFGDVASDDALKGGNPGDQSDMGFIDEFTVSADNGFIESIWKHYYEGITRANKVIYYGPGITMDEDLYKRLKKQRTVILVCDNGTNSSRCTDQLRQEGFESVFSLQGGLSAWQQENLPVVASGQT